MAQVSIVRFGLKGFFKISQETPAGVHTSLVNSAFIVGIDDHGENGFRICTVNPTTAATYDFHGMTAEQAGKLFCA